MRRLATLLAALLLASPAAAFAQGAGDDQYQDPFGDEASQSNGSGSEGGLSDEPPVTGGGSSGSSGSSGSGSGSSGSGSSGAGSSGSGTAPSTGSETPAATAAPGTLPRTGSEPLLLMGLGMAFVLTGVGLRLRTIDPNAF